MSIVHVRMVILDGKKTYEVKEGVSLYTPFTTHYKLNPGNELEGQFGKQLKELLIHSKARGIIPRGISTPVDPPIKRKL